MDDFDRATVAARHCATALIETQVPPVIAADALICQALSLWAADSHRHIAARMLLKIWTALRDAH